MTEDGRTDHDPTGAASGTPAATAPGPLGAGPTGASDGSWQRLAWGMLLVQPIRELLRFVPLLLVLLVVGRSDGASRPPWEFVAAGLVILYGVGRFLSTRWRVTPTAVEVRHGVVGRRLLTAPRERIRSIDISAHPLQRVLGLVKVHIGTGTSGPLARGVQLDGLPRSTAERLRAELLHTGGPAPDPAAAKAATFDRADAAPGTDPGGRVLAAFRPRWIGYGPATLSGVVTAAAVLALGLRLLSEAQVRPTDLGPVAAFVRHLAAVPWWVAALQVLAIVLVVTTVLSLGGYVLSYWGFRLVRHDRTGEPGLPDADRAAQDRALQTSRGLLSTRATTIAEHRLHGVERIEPLLLRAVGGARLVAIATGLRGGREAGRGGDLLVPPAPRATVLEVERAVLTDSPDADGHPVDHTTAPLRPRGPAARRRRYTRALLGVAVVTAVAVVLWWRALVPGWVPITTAALVVPAALLARDRFASLGHTLLRGATRSSGGDLLVSRLGSLVRRRVTLRRRGAVGVVLRSSPFQRRSRLVTLTVTTAAGAQHYELPDLDRSVAVGLAAELVPVVGQFRTDARSGCEAGQA